jgi:hypothetical protein
MTPVQSGMYCFNPSRSTAGGGRLQAWPLGIFPNIQGNRISNLTTSAFFWRIRKRPPKPPPLRSRVITAVSKAARPPSLPTSSETAYYLLSTPMPPARFAQAAREHWGGPGKFRILQLAEEERFVVGGAEAVNACCALSLLRSMEDQPAGKVPRRRNPAPML